MKARFKFESKARVILPGTAVLGIVMHRAQRKTYNEYGVMFGHHILWFQEASLRLAK